MASQLVVLAFEGQYQAEGMLEVLQGMQERGLLVLEDAVVVENNVGGNLELKQTLKKGTGKAAAKGAGVGLIAGLLLGGPILGLAAGAAIAGINRSMKDYGIEDEFIEKISEGLRPETSALFLLVKDVKGEEVLTELSKYKAMVVTTSLPDEQRERLEQALEKEA